MNTLLAAIIALLIAVGCRGADLYPDTFSIGYSESEGDYDGSVGRGHHAWPMSGDSSGQTIGFTLGWKLDEAATARQQREYLEALYGVRDAMLERASAPAPVPAVTPAEPVAAPVAPPAAAPKHDEDGKGDLALKLLPSVLALALAVVGLLNKMGRVDWLEHKGGH